MPKVEMNTKAPDFILEDFSGEQFKLSDYQAKKNILLVLNRGFV